jgi:hypothetical protein
VFALAAIGMVIVGAGDVVMAYMVTPIVQNLQHPDTAATLRLPLAVVLVFMLRGLRSFMSEYGMAWTGHRVVFDLRRQMIERLLTLPRSYYDAQSSGRLISRFTFDAYQLGEAPRFGVPATALPIGRKRSQGVVALRLLLAAHAVDVINAHRSTDAWLVAQRVYRQRDPASADPRNWRRPVARDLDSLRRRSGARGAERRSCQLSCQLRRTAAIAWAMARMSDNAILVRSGSTTANFMGSGTAPSRFAGRARVVVQAVGRRATSVGRRRPPRDPRRILIAHHLLLGDTLTLTPLLAKLRERYPRADLIMALPEPFAPLYAYAPYGVHAVGWNPRTPAARRYPETPAAWADIVATLVDGPAPARYGRSDWHDPPAAPFDLPSRAYVVLHVGASTPLKQ